MLMAMRTHMCHRIVVKRFNSGMTWRERENGSISFRPGNFADFVSSARSLSVVANANSSNNKPLTIMAQRWNYFPNQKVYLRYGSPQPS